MYYTPTTEEVRQQWGYNYPDYDNEHAAFDRWIAEVKAQAWEDGAVWQRANAVPDDRRMKVRFVSELQAVNPYRKGEK